MIRDALALRLVLAMACAGGFGGDAVAAVEPTTTVPSPATTAAPTTTGTTPPLPPPRPVDALLKDIVDALGGADNLNRHTTMYTRVEITLRGLGMTGSAEHFATVGGRSLTVTTISGLASTREGCDGQQCWSEDPINGLRILRGAEAEQALLETAWNPELRFKELFAKLEIKNERDENGALLECLILTPRQSAAWTNCFDATTHLLTLQRVIHAGPQGEVPFTSHFGDWRRVEDIEVPYFTEMQAGPLAFTGTVTAIELDRVIAAKRFAIPTTPAESSSAEPETGGSRKSGKAGKITPKAKTGKVVAPALKPKG